MPARPPVSESAGEKKFAQQIWVIRNAQLSVQPQQIQPRISAIGVRSVSLMIRSQGLNDVYRIYSHAERDNVGFNLAYLGPDFTEESSEVFDPEFMRQLYDFGFQQAVSGQPWVQIPPGIAVSE